MNIPQRLWRVLRGHVSLARQRAGERRREPEPAEVEELAEALAEARALAEAARELAEHPDAQPRAIPSGRVQRSRSAGRTDPARHDPLESYYRELQLEPGADLGALDAAYEARLAEIHPELYPVGSPERETVEAQKASIEEAYERLRDAINVTETRFERLELDG